MKAYVEKDVVDKNIGACCSALNAIAKCCPEYFNEILTASLIDYLARLLHTPQNYLFLTGKDIAEIRDTLATLGGYTFRGSVSKNNAVGLLRECIGKIVEYRSSTVEEEAQVVVRMTETLPVIFNMCLNQGQNSFSFIDPDFLDLELAGASEKGRHRRPANSRQGPGSPGESGLPRPPDPGGKSSLAAGGSAKPAGRAGRGGGRAARGQGSGVQSSLRRSTAFWTAQTPIFLALSETFFTAIWLRWRMSRGFSRACSRSKGS